MSGTELGDFLRARRGQLQPPQVGLRDAGRRRTPGLRREEVASIAGVSIDYLVRLEQGRETNPSVGVLASLADALLLSEEEHRHLYTLASLAHDDVGPCIPTDGPSDHVAPSVRAVLDQLAVPAHVVGPYGDVLAWNPLWGGLANGLGLLGGAHHGNLARFVFLDPTAHEVLADWSALADTLTSQLRNATVRWPRDHDLRAFVNELRHTPEFARRWDAYPVTEDLRGALGLHHPTLGLLAVTVETLLVPDHDGQRLVCWLPADERTATALATASPPAGRAQGG